MSAVYRDGPSSNVSATVRSCRGVCGPRATGPADAGGGGGGTGMAWAGASAPIASNTATVTSTDTGFVRRTVRFWPPDQDKTSIRDGTSTDGARVSPLRRRPEWSLRANRAFPHINPENGSLLPTLVA